MVESRARRTARPGSVWVIDLGTGAAAVARALHGPLFEFFDLVVPNGREVDLEKLAGAPVLFRIPVMDSAVTSGRWRVVGEIPLDDHERHRREMFFKQDAITGRLSVYAEDPITGEVFERPAELSECASLERAAVWDATHVQDRLRDHHAGRPNTWVESLRPREPRS